MIEHNGKEILRIIMENGELEEDKVYRVSTSDYLQRGTGYEALANNTNKRYNPEYIRDTLRDYLNRQSFINKCFTDRWIKVDV